LNNTVPAGGGHNEGEDSPSEIVHIPFHGDDVLTVSVDGQPEIIMKPVLEGLGLDYWAQVRKLRDRSWATTASRAVVAADGKTRDMITCDIRTFLMLLATIDENRVAAEVRPKLVIYQAEVADAIEAYWTKGVAINPRVSHEEAAKVIAVFAQAGIGDAGFWDTKARQLTGRVLGETPEYDQESKPLTVSIYLKDQGLKDADIRKVCGSFGKALKKKYVEAYGVKPPEIEDLVNRQMVMVAQYQERHRDLFDSVWRALSRTAGGPTRPRNRRK
jgi:hypothetical protein